MVTELKRKIVSIDEELCDGCGECIIACAEGALQIIDGKAKLVNDKYCDGLAACLGDCPRGAITIIEREAEAFDEEAVQQHLEAEEGAAEELPPGCPSAAVAWFDRQQPATAVPNPASYQQPALSHWPIQLTLVPPDAPFLQGVDLLLGADCVPFAYAGFHSEILKDHALLIACPKLDDIQAHQVKLDAILSQSRINSLTVVHMEVPCCFGLVQMARQAIRSSGKDIPFKKIAIGINGDLESLI